jgi:hypothetical protein
MGALIFMPALVGAVVFGFIFLLFACNYYLTVLESSGAGAKEVTWISEPIIDNAWKLAYLGWLGGLWFGPAYLIGRAATGSSTGWITLAVPLMVFWLCFPVSQLSSLAAGSLWMPLVPDVIVRLLQKPLVVLGFLALSAVALGALGVGFQWTFFTQGEWSLLFVGAPLVVVSGLMYARLLGRLAFAMRFTTGLFATKRRKKKPKPPPAAPAPVEPPTQPSELPPLMSPEGELQGYDILTADEAPRPPRKRVRAVVAEPEAAEPELAEPPPPRARDDWEDDDDHSRYEMKEAEADPADNTPREVIEPSKLELELLNRDDAPKPPARVWGPELFAFLAQPGTISAILIASLFCFATGVMIRVAREFNPAAGG